ncbi:MAG TPA: MFS transporter, partial [Candidatus Bathyarchaeota archaeon]|nr:MFS transporter [Candidatus Bathyarchaeota archaeon]
RFIFLIYYGDLVELLGRSGELGLRLFRTVTTFFNRQKSNFNVLITRGILSNFQKGLVQNYTSIYIVELGADPVQLGGLNGIGSLFNVFISAPIGWLADKYSLKTAFLVGLIFESLVPLFYALSWCWQMLVIPVILSSLTMVTTMTMERVLTADSLKDRDRATGFGLYMAISQVSSTISPVIAGIIVTQLGGISVRAIRPLFYLAFIVSASATLWVYLKLKDTGPAPNLKSESFIRGFRSIFEGRWWLKRWLIVELLGSFTFGSTIPFVMVYAAQIKGADAMTLGLMGAALSLVATFFSIPFGRLADKIGRKKMILLIRPALYLSYILLILAPSPTFLILAFALRGLLWSGVNVYASMQMELVPATDRGRWGGTINTFRSIVRIPAPVVGGLLWTYVDPAFPFIFLILVDSIIRMPILWTVPDPLKDKERMRVNR